MTTNSNNISYIEHDLGYKKISEAVLSSYGESFTITQSCMDNLGYTVQQLNNINQLWNESNFEKINLPHNLFSLDATEIAAYSTGKDIRILDMPIKFPGSDYKIPHELVALSPLIKKIVAHEHNINNDIDNYYCYLTLDRRLVRSGNTTRKSGIHVDGFQGARLGEKLPVDHSYILSNVLPTLFYNQPFKVEKEWDKSCHNYFEGFEKQKRENNVIAYLANTVLLMDAYCLHEAPVATIDTHRTFLRLSYTVREFDRLGNAHNHMFDYDWQMFPRDIQSTLLCPYK